MKEVLRGVKSHWIEIGAIALLMVLPFIAYYRVMLGEIIWMEGDFSSYQIPINTVTIDSWRSFKLPLWNPYIEGGLVFGAAQNPAPFYPFTIILSFFLSNWALLAHSILLHLSLMGLGMYLFLRSLRLSIAACVFGALAFQWNGFAASHLGHVMFLRALPWIGFSLAGWNYWRETGLSRYLFLIAFSGMCLCLSGYPQIILYALLLICSYVLFAHTSTWRALFLGAAAFMLGVGMAGIQLVPGLIMFWSEEFYRPGESSYASFTSGPFHPSYVLTFLFPMARTGDYSEMVGYVGGITFLFGLMAICLRMPSHTRLKRFFCIWAALSLVLAFGRFIPALTELTYHIPLYRLFTGLNRHLMEFDFCIIALAALAVERTFSRPHWNVSWIAVLNLILAGGALAAWAIMAPPKGPEVYEFFLRGEPVSELFLSPLYRLAAAVVLAAVAYHAGTKIRTAAFLVVLSLSGYELIQFSKTIYYPGAASPVFHTTVPETVAHFTAEKPFRVISFEAGGGMPDRELAKQLLAANFSMTYRIESLVGHEGLQLRRFLHGFNTWIPSWGAVRIDAVEDPVFRERLNLFGVRYLLARKSEEGKLTPYYPLIGETSRVKIFENPGAKPRLFFRPSQSGVAADEVIRIEEYSGDAITAEVTVGTEGTLVHGTNFVSGWQVSVNGEQKELLIIDTIAQGVALTPGTYKVSFKFAPTSTYYALFSLGASAVALLLLCYYFRRRRDSILAL